MTAGQVWQRPDGLHWVEIQNEAMEPSGWRIVVPLLDPAEAPEAPPLVIAVNGWHARVHLLTSAPVDELGLRHQHLDAQDVDALRGAVGALINE